MVIRLGRSSATIKIEAGIPAKRYAPNPVTNYGKTAVKPGEKINIKLTHTAGIIPGFPSRQSRNRFCHRGRPPGCPAGRMGRTESYYKAMKAPQQPGGRTPQMRTGFRR